MDNAKQDKLEQSKKSKCSKHVKISSSGRVIKTPKKIVTTSSDDAPPRKRTASSKIMSSEVERLKRLADNIRKEKQVEGNDASKDIENRAIFNVSSYSEAGSNQLPSTVSISKDSYHDNSEKTPSKNNNLFQRTVPSSSVTAVASGSKPSTQKNILKSHNFDVKLVFGSTKHNAQTATKSKPPLHDDERIEDASYFLNDIAKRLKKVEQQNEEIIMQNKDILHELSQQKMGEAELRDNRLYATLKGLPLSTVAEFKEMDNVDNKERRKQLYIHLLRLGGTKLREFLNTALKETMTDNLVCQFTWKENKGTEKFGDTRVSNILYYAAKDCPLFHGPDNKAQLKTEMQEVMRATKQRHRNNIKKLLPNEQSETEDEDDAIHHRQINELEDQIAEKSEDSLIDRAESEQYDGDTDSESL